MCQHTPKPRARHIQIARTRTPIAGTGDAQEALAQHGQAHIFARRRIRNAPAPYPPHSRRRAGAYCAGMGLVESAVRCQRRTHQMRSGPAPSRYGRRSFRFQEGFGVPVVP